MMFWLQLKCHPYYPMTTDKQDVIDQPGIAQSGIHIVQNKIFFASDT